MPTHASEPPVSPAAPRRVLVVEDCDEVRELLIELCRGEGCEVFGAASAEEGIAILERLGPCDCVVSDQELGATTGIEMFAELAERWPAMTRVLVTGYAEIDLAIRALHQGRIFRLLRKPFLPAQVREALREGLAHADGLRRERELTDELSFARESLTQMLGELEGRLEAEIDSLQGVQELAVRLGNAESLSEVADAAAEAVSRALGGRAVRVELAPDSDDEGPTGAVVGGARDERQLDAVSLQGEAQPRIFIEDASGLTERDRRVLGSLASSTALAARSQVNREERRQAEHATVFALARLAERRDNETGQHLVRVSEYTRLIAYGLRAAGHYTDELTDRFIDDVVRSAPLHDIGKVGIPDCILLKPGRLTTSEWEIMRRHTIIGGDTLRSVIENTSRPGFLRAAHDIALYHHEKWNGSGYPKGLKGVDIPLSARIVALADVYDALTTRRPYKDPWPHADAMELIQRERGEHFDPRVVDVFAASEEAVTAIRLGHPDEDESGAEAMRAA